MKRAFQFFRRGLSVVLTAGLILNSTPIPARADELLTSEEDSLLWDPSADIETVGEGLIPGSSGIDSTEEILPEEEALFDDDEEDAGSDADRTEGAAPFAEDNSEEASVSEEILEEVPSEDADLTGIETTDEDLLTDGGEEPDEVGAKAITSWENLQSALKDPGSWGKCGTEGYILTLGSSIKAGSKDSALIFDYKQLPVILDLRGYSIDRGLGNTTACKRDGTGSVLRITAGTLTICDSSPAGRGKITGGHEQFGGGIVLKGGTLVLEGGNISGSKGQRGGAGIYVSGGSFTMKGGQISKNTLTNGGGGGAGLAVYGGTASLQGGIITENSGSDGSGLYVSGGRAVLEGTDVKANTGTSGGSEVCVANGALTIRSGSIRNPLLTNAMTLRSETGSCTYFGGEIPGRILVANEKNALILGAPLAEGTMLTFATGGKERKVVKNYSEFYSDSPASHFASADSNLGVCLKDGAVILTQNHGEIFESFTWNGKDAAVANLHCSVCGASFQKAAEVTGPAINVEEKKIGYTAKITVNGQEYTEWKAAPDEDQPATRIVTSWAELQEALWDGGDMAWDQEIGMQMRQIRLYMDITAGESDGPLIFSYRPAAVILDLNGFEINRNLQAARKNSGHSLQLEDGTLILRDSKGGGKITGGNGVKGGGVVVSGGTLQLTGGSITGNRVSNDGGGVYVAGGTLIQSGGSISGNEAGVDGGGVFVERGSYELNGGTVSDNKTHVLGGGIMVTGGDCFLRGGTVSGNKSDGGGGGLGLENKGHVILSGTTFSENGSETYGGGIRVKGGVLELSGGTITGNTGWYGCGVCFEGGTLNLSGSPRIYGNRRSGQIRESNFLVTEENCPVTITGSLGEDIRFSVDTFGKEGTKLFTNYSQFMKEAPSSHFVSENTEYVICLSEDGSVVNRKEHSLKVAFTWNGDESATAALSCEYCHEIRGEAVQAEVTGPTLDIGRKAFVYTARAVIDGQEYTDVKKAENQPEERIITSWEELQVALRDGGDQVWDKEKNDWMRLIRLYMDITAGPYDSTLVYNYPLDTPVVLDLNGHSIDRNGKNMSMYEYGGTVLRSESGTLVIRDSAGGGTITGGAGTGGGLNIKGGTVILESGSISGNTNCLSGGGVYVYQGLFRMTGGSITGNKAESDGGGLSVGSGNAHAEILGGSIRGNAGYEGGVYIKDGSLTIGSDAVITENKATWGAGLYVSGGTVSLGSPVISGTIYFSSSKGVLSLTESLKEGTVYTVAMTQNHGPVFTENYDKYHEGIHPETFFASEDKNFILCKGEDGKEAALVKEHTYEVAWTWEGYTRAAAALSCSRCGAAIWNMEADSIEGPVYDAEKDAFVFTAKLVKDDKEYTGSIQVKEPFRKAAQTNPSIAEDGGYIYGQKEHYELTIGDTTYLYAVTETVPVPGVLNGATGEPLKKEIPGARVTEKELLLSWFDFNGNTAVRYTGPIVESSAPYQPPAKNGGQPESETGEDPSELSDVFTIELPKYYTDGEGKPVEVTKIGNGNTDGTGVFFTSDKYAVKSTANITEVSAHAFENSGFAGITGDTANLTVIGEKAFASNKAVMNKLYLKAEHPITAGEGAFDGFSEPADPGKEPVPGLTVYVMHASGLPEGLCGKGVNLYQVSYLDAHQFAVDPEKTVWAEDYSTAAVVLKCTAGTACQEELTFEDVPVTCEVRENDVLYSAEVTKDGKTYTANTTGPRMKVILTHGNGGGSDLTIYSGVRYTLPKDAGGFTPPEECGMEVTWKTDSLPSAAYKPGETVTLKSETTVFEAVWRSTWAGVSEALASGKTVNLYNTIDPEDSGKTPETGGGSSGGAIIIPKGTTATLNLNGYTVNRGLQTQIDDGYVFRVAGTLNVNGEGSIVGGCNTGNGGAFYVEGSGRLNLHEVFLYANRAENGGGIFMANGSRVKISGKVYKDDSKTKTKITHGRADKRGGGIYVSKNSLLELKGVLIERNTAGIEGGGIYVEKDGEVDFDGDNKVKNNKNDKGKKDNTWVKDVAVIVIIGGIIGGLAWLGFNMFGPSTAAAAAGAGAGTISLDTGDSSNGDEEKDKDDKKCDHPSYKAVVWVWDEAGYTFASVTLACTKCGDTCSENASITTKEEEDKTTKYTAKASKKGKDYEDTRSVDPYKVTLKPGYDGGDEKTEKVAHRKNLPATYNLPDSKWTRDGFRFAGWEVNGMIYQAKTPQVIYDDTTATAQWKEQVKLTFEKGADDAQGEMTPVTKDKDEVYNLPGCDFTRENYEFDGWIITGENDPAPSSDGKTPENKKKAGEPVTLDENKKATASWKEDPVVTFDKNAADAKLKEGAKDDPVHVKTGREYTLPECMYEREDYSFTGWKIITDSDAPAPEGKDDAPAPAGNETGEYETKKPGEKITVNGDVKAVAQWKEDPKVSFEKGNDNAKLKEGMKDDPAHVKSGKEYELPECMYEREGYSFIGWKITKADNAAPAPDSTPGEPEVIKKAGEKITVTEDMIATATWKGKPVFKGHTMVLTGQIGLIFGIEFQENIKTEGSYMEFTVHGKTTRVNTIDAETASDGRKLYTVYIDALMMAETIKAVLHYEDDQTVSQEYTAERYIKFFEEHSAEYDQATLDVVRSVADYGHFAQPYLADYNGWTYGVDYATMSTHYQDSYDEEEVRTGAAGYQFNVDAGTSAIDKVHYSLRLDSETALSVYIKVKNNTPLTASASLNGKTFRSERMSDGRYRVRVEGINASQLADTITISGSCGGNFTISVSGMAYVRTLLNSEDYKDNTKAKNMVMALYYYYKKTLAFRNAR